MITDNLVVNGLIKVTSQAEVNTLTVDQVNDTSGEDIAQLQGATSNVQEQINALATSYDESINNSTEFKTGVANAVNSLSDEPNLNSESTLEQYVAAISLLGGKNYKGRLTASDDLDNVSDDGFYDIVSTDQPVHIPSDCGGMNACVEVFNLPEIETIYQRYHRFQGEVFTYSRRKFNGAWSNWVAYTFGVKGNAEASYRSGNVNITPENIGAISTSGGTVTGTISSSLVTNTYLAGNKGSAIINSTAGAGTYVMLSKMNSTNGYFTQGVYNGNYHLQYTAKSTVDAGTNSVTKSVTLLDESGNSSFPGTVTASAFNGNASTATKLATARTISLTGSVTGSGTFDGSGNLNIATSTNHSHNYAGSPSAGGPANVVKGDYTSNGGQQQPNYFGTNKVGFLMMNTSVNSNINFKDWIIMDCYSGSDVGGAVAFGVNRQMLGAYIMRSNASRDSWAESAELLHSSNYKNFCTPANIGAAVGKLLTSSDDILSINQSGMYYWTVASKPTNGWTSGGGGGDWTVGCIIFCTGNYRLALSIDYYSNCTRFAVWTSSSTSITWTSSIRKTVTTFSGTSSDAISAMHLNNTTINGSPTIMKRLTNLEAGVANIGTRTIITTYTVTNTAHSSTPTACMELINMGGGMYMCRLIVSVCTITTGTGTLQLTLDSSDSNYELAKSIRLLTPTSTPFITTNYGPPGGVYSSYIHSQYNLFFWSYYDTSYGLTRLNIASNTTFTTSDTCVTTFFGTTNNVVYYYDGREH